MPLWEWILVAASLAIPVTAVSVATTLMADERAVRFATSTPGVRLGVPSFATLAPGVSGESEPAPAYG